MKTITLKLTKTETDSIWGKTNSNTLEFFRLMECYDKNETFTHHECEVFDVDKFREFLNDEIKNTLSIIENTAENDTDLWNEYDNLKSILSKLDKAVVLNNLQKQVCKLEGLEGLLDEITEACSYAESDGQFYNGIRIDEDTILVLMSYWDKHTTLTEYFHYSISKNELVKVDAEMDEKYRDLFEDCDMLDSFNNCFYIVGIEPTKDKAKIVYGDEYNDTIVNLDVVQNDCDNCDSSGYIPENTEGGNKECPECSDEPKCCDDDDNLEWVAEGECFPYEVWKCSKCEKMYNVEMVRDFKNKEIRNVNK